MAQPINAPQWIARCANVLSTMLPGMGTATADERGAQLLTEAFGYPPGIAAAVYANESELQGLLGGGHVGGAGEWKLIFDLDGGSEDEIAHGVAAAADVLKARGVSAYCGGVAKFRLDGFDDAGFDHRYALTAKEDEDLQAWFDAERAANLALNAGDPAGQRCGELGAVPPEAISFAKAHRRWVEGWSETPVEMTPSHPRGLWLDRFTSRLGKLRPAMTPASAWQYAETTFELAADMEPEKAAEVFAAQDPPDDLGAPE